VPRSASRRTEKDPEAPGETPGAATETVALPKLLPLLHSCSSIKKCFLQGSIPACEFRRLSSRLVMLNKKWSLRTSMRCTLDIARERTPCAASRNDLRVMKPKHRERVGFRRLKFSEEQVLAAFFYFFSKLGVHRIAFGRRWAKLVQDNRLAPIIAAVITIRRIARGKVFNFPNP